jgi:hypothetical protein
MYVCIYVESYEYVNVRICFSASFLHRDLENIYGGRTILETIISHVSVYITVVFNCLKCSRVKV